MGSWWRAAILLVLADAASADESISGADLVRYFDTRHPAVALARAYPHSTDILPGI